MAELKALYQSIGTAGAGGSEPPVSAVATPEQLAALLAEVWPKSTAKPSPRRPLRRPCSRDCSAASPAVLTLISAKERKVAEQFEGNRYVGIHIALGMNDQEKRAAIAEVFEGGPADRAGAKNGDLIEKIDGVDTKGMALAEVVDRLRGEEGTEVTITVRQPKADESRTLHDHPRSARASTVHGCSQAAVGRLGRACSTAATRSATCGSPRSPPVLRTSFASWPRSSKTRALRPRSRPARGRRRERRSIPRSCWPIACSTGGMIGRVRTAEREMTYQADSDALFRGWPIAVLVDAMHGGTAEWLAAALQDNHRAMIVGSPTFSAMGATRAESAGGRT